MKYFEINIMNKAIITSNLTITMEANLQILA